jgi:hypothetical protein
VNYTDYKIKNTLSKGISHEAKHNNNRRLFKLALWTSDAEQGDVNKRIGLIFRNKLGLNEESIRYEVHKVTLTFSIRKLDNTFSGRINSNRLFSQAEVCPQQGETARDRRKFQVD